VAAALTLAVVDGHNSGIGGGCFLVIRTEPGRLEAIDGRETAPALATRDMFLRDGKPVSALSQVGPLAVGTPGALAAYDLALRRFGRLKLADLLGEAAELAELGFPIDRIYAARLKGTADELARFPGSRAALLKPDGSPYRTGEVLRQPDLARTYRKIAEHGPGWFYGGPFAQRVSEWMAEHGGALRAEDFARYRPRLRKPVVSSYRGYTVVGFPPPSSGGVHVAQMLNILERFDLKELHERRPAVFYHVLAEAVKLAFADRAHWLGDPAFARVPRGLTDKDYAAELAARIDLDRTTTVPGHGTPPRSEHDFFGRKKGEGSGGGKGERGEREKKIDGVCYPDAFQRREGAINPLQETDSSSFPLSPFSPFSNPPPPFASARHTTHVAAADKAGNWVAITATVNTSFGSKVIVPGTGVVLNNEMDDFAAAPGVPNVYGLIGAEANAVAPGKRPLSSMSPTVVLEDGRPILTLGAAGGPMIITQVLQAIVHHLDLGRPLPEAVAAPRIHHQWKPDVLRVERPLPEPVVEDLKRLGHPVQRAGYMGYLQAVGFTPDGKLIAVREPRLGRGKEEE
jgi:gamma-glutamyltranspeptidase / glutathione hydrolase